MLNLWFSSLPTSMPNCQGPPQTLDRSQRTCTKTLREKWCDSLATKGNSGIKCLQSNHSKILSICFSFWVVFSSGSTVFIVSCGLLPLIDPGLVQCFLSSRGGLLDCDSTASLEISGKTKVSCENTSHWPFYFRNVDYTFCIYGIYMDYIWDLYKCICIYDICIYDMILSILV